MDYEAMINKSLEEVDTLVENINKSRKEEEDLEKSLPEDDVTPEDISDSEAPQDTDEDEDREDDNEDVPVDADEDEHYEKSLTSELESNDNTRKALEISEFLQELVKSMDTVISHKTDEISKSVISSAEESNGLLAKSVRGIALGQKAVLETNAEILKSFKAMNKRLAQLESQPVVRKSVSSPAQIIEKSFQESLGETQQKSTTLSKSQASAKLTQAYESGNTEVINDILALEGTGNFESLSDAGKQVLGLL